MLRLEQGGAVLTLRPDLGGAITSLSVCGQDVLQNSRDIPNATPPDLSSIILTPFSNRISGNGFNWDGQFWEVSPNLKGEALPIHGDGFQKPWGITSKSNQSISLNFTDGNIGPFRYAAAQHFDLGATYLQITLDIENRGKLALPFGCGFHPRFPRTNETRLSFKSRGYWENNDQHCSQEFIALEANSDFDFSRPRALPNSLINHGFSAQPGLITITQGFNFKSARLSASHNLSTVIIYSPGQQADFFCCEPVSHPIDAINLPGRPGLTILAPQQRLSARMRIDWD